MMRPLICLLTRTPTADLVMFHTRPVRPWNLGMPLWMAPFTLMSTKSPTLYMVRVFMEGRPWLPKPFENMSRVLRRTPLALPHPILIS
eukprot:08594_6